MTVSKSTLHQHLTQLANSSDNALTKEVAEIILDQGEENIATFLSDLFQHGCISGMVGPLIYYADTRAFYDRNYHEIEELRETYEDETGTPIVIQGDLKNFMAWFAFEYTAYEIAQKFEW